MQIFGLFDKQGDGKIEINQIGDACRALGLNPKQDVIKKLVNQLDNERNGARLSFQDFQPIYASLAKEKSAGSASDFIDGLRMFDSDGSGLISVSELRHILTNIGDRLTNKELDDILREMRVDGGQVNYEDFVRHVMSE
ncbi:Myosin-2 essential light chain [Holothuria leucospilota]|uniref:Myosin-2 essential light chain n=1 Tax=Holothuria leucospilota TaxID=206669 RepID=A0A9Q1BKM6_HOLLE|nr:Myosin-2 essential light chain [Holothuria leucospilota]